MLEGVEVAQSYSLTFSQSLIALPTFDKLAGAIGGLIIPYIPDAQCYMYCQS